MESKQIKNENDALQIASNDVFKIDYSSTSDKFVYTDHHHVIELNSDRQDSDVHSTSQQQNQIEKLTQQFENSTNQQLNNSNDHLCNYTQINNDEENSDESSRMLIIDKQNVIIVKMNDYCNDNHRLINDTNLNMSDVNKKQEQEEKKDLNHHSSRYSHEHHHHYQFGNRTMDLVFRNVHVSIPTTQINAKKSTINQTKEQIVTNNWFKQICSKIYFSNDTYKLQTTKVITDSMDNHREILSGISGYCRPGQLLACMGPSSAGKTTLLNTLSGRLKMRKGSITINGEEMNKQMKRKIGYVMQNDVFFAGLTLRQTLVYTALLRMPDLISRAKKMKHVQRVIELLDLTACQDTIIGDFMKRGLSGGEKKRASIACELLTNPSIMLLDEPTSGLDSCTAFNLMQKIKDYAIKEGKTVIATIHQPSSQLFYMFDKLLLLANGQCAYFGKSTHVVPFFENSLGYTISTHYNPADLMMEKIKQKDELPKIVKAAKSLIKNYSILSHNHRRGSNASKHLLKLNTSNKIESQADWSLIGMEDELDHSDNHHSQIDNQPHHHHCNHFQKHHLNTLKESTECTNYKQQDIQNNHADLCLDLCCCSKRTNNGGCKIMIRSIHDDDSGRSSSWTETDRSSTATFSSSNSCSSSTCSTEDVYSEVNFEIEPNSQQNTKLTNRTNSNLNEHYLSKNSKWPTSFLTQVKVLTRRNFCETRQRMLSKLNWIQTILLGILSGLMWFQMDRSESTLNDLKGFLFFSISYWMLFAWFGVLISIPGQHEVMKKERSSGAYRLSAFYIAKMIGELPLIIALPSLYFFICYPLFAINLNIYNFLFQFLFIGLTTMSLDVSVTVSAIYSTAVNLFGGYYSNTLPNWLAWMRYTSVLHYAYENMQIIEYKYGGRIRCANVNSKFNYCLKRIADLKEKFLADSLHNNKLTPTDEQLNSLINRQLNDKNQALYIPYDELISELNSSSFWINVLILILFLLLFRLLGYLVLRFR